MSAAVIISVAVALVVLIAFVLVERRIRSDLREERRRGLNREAAAGMGKVTAVGKSCLGAFLLGFAPTILLVLAYEFAPVAAAERLIAATAVFGLAVLAAMLFRLARPLPDVPNLPWRNGLIVVMAGLTVGLHDELFIKVRPTISNLIGAVLAFAAAMGVSPWLDALFRRDRVSLDDAGWRKLVLGGAVLGIAMAAINEYVRRFMSEEFWVYFQLWGPVLLFGTFVLLAYLFLKDHLTGGQCPARASNDQ